MRTRNPLVLWLLGASLALPAITTAQVVQAVSVSQEQGQTLISITGERLPRPNVSVWRSQFLVIEFNARFSGRGREVSQNTPHLIKLRYGWFSNRPPKVRVVATMRGSPPHTLEQTPTGWQVRLGKATVERAEVSEPPDFKPVDAAPKPTTVASARPTPPRTYAPEPNAAREGTPVASAAEPLRPAAPPRTPRVPRFRERRNRRCAKSAGDSIRREHPHRARCQRHGHGQSQPPHGRGIAEPHHAAERLPL
jgi:hypothetical protein